MDGNFHRAFGVYGICEQNNRLLVIKKNAGPYINRYDLPGGNLEEKESLSEALKREVLEETGYKVNIIRQLGVADFVLPWSWRDFSHVHHIAVFYEVEIQGGGTLFLKSLTDKTH